MIFVAIFIGICIAGALWAVVQPVRIAELHARYFQWSMKVFGFECQVRPTSKAAKLIRIWNICFLIYLVSAYFLIFKIL
jgi:hypothetical protein